MDSAEFSDGSYGFAPSVTTSRFPSEDWVSQARGLSIDNATPYDSRSTNPSLENLGSQSGDVDMVSSNPRLLQSRQLAHPVPRWTRRTLSLYKYLVSLVPVIRHRKPVSIQQHLSDQFRVYSPGCYSPRSTLHRRLLAALSHHRSQTALKTSLSWRTLHHP